MSHAIEVLENRRDNILKSIDIISRSKDEKYVSKRMDKLTPQLNDINIALEVLTNY
jgi:hypothetical protein